MDALANPSLQRGLSLALVAIAAAGALIGAAMLVSARASNQAGARLRRRRVGVVALFVAVAAGAALAALSAPVEQAARAPLEAAARPGPASEPEVVSARRFSSAKMPALSLDAPDGWQLQLDEAARKLTASSTGGARLLITTAALTEAIDVDLLLGQLADRQRALGFEVGEPFKDRLGDLPAAGFVATAGTRSVRFWMVRRDTHLVSSVICSTDGKQPARDACRAPLATLRWRAP